jgi:lipoyl-dependent peroxiredoxin
MTQIKKVLYTAKTHTTGGRQSGVSRSSDGRLDVKFSTPDASGTGTNPEQLLALFSTALDTPALGLKTGVPRLQVIAARRST